MTHVLLGMVLLLADNPAIAASPDYTAYWLFDSRIDAGQSYGPVLLLTRLPFDQLKARSDLYETVSQLGGDKEAPLLEADALSIETHRKDSIWNADRRPIKSIGRVTEINDTKSIITIDGRRYSAQAAKIEDVVRLLENPAGTITLHRLHAPLAGAEQTTRALILLLKDQLERKGKGK